MKLIKNFKKSNNFNVKDEHDNLLILFFKSIKITIFQCMQVDLLHGFFPQILVFSAATIGIVCVCFTCTLCTVQSEIKTAGQREGYSAVSCLWLLLFSVHCQLCSCFQTAQWYWFVNISFSFRFEFFLNNWFVKRFVNCCRRKLYEFANLS